MAIELLQAQTSGQQALTQGVVLVPDVFGTSAEAELYSPEGTLKATLTTTPDSYSQAVTVVGASPDLLTMASVTGLVVGREYWYVSASGWAAKVRIAEIASLVVRLETPPASTPAVGDLLKGLQFTVAILGLYLTTRARNYRIDWRVTSADAVRGYRQVLHVVAMQFRPPVTPDDAKRMALDSHRNWALGESYGTWLRIAEDATDRVRKILTKDEDYPHWIGDQDAFRAAGEIACRLALAAKGRIPPGFDGATFEADQELRLKAACRDAIGGVWVDRDESNSSDAGETLGAHNTTIERV